MKDKKKLYPLTLPQQSFFLDYLIHENNSKYNSAGLFILNGFLDVQLFKKSFEYAIKKHDILQLRFELNENDLFQYLDPSTGRNFDYQDLRNSPLSFNEIIQNLFKENERPTSFLNTSLNSERILQTRDNQFIWFTRFHHFANDGYGRSLISNTISKTYNSLVENNCYPDIKAFSYLDFLAEDLIYRKSEAYNKSIEYWKEKLTPLPSPFDFSIKKNNLKKKSLASEKINLSIDHMCYSSVLKVSEECGVSIFQALLGVFYIALSKFWNKKEIIVGMPVLNRSNYKFKNTAGLFMGLIPFRIQIQDESSFKDFINDIKAEARGIYRHQRLPLGEVINHFRSDTNFLGEIFDVTINYSKMDFSQRFGKAKLQSINIDAPIQSESLSLQIDEFGGEENVNLHFNYNPQVFSEEEILQFVKCFNNLLIELFFFPDKKINEINLLDLDDYDKIVNKFNETAYFYSRDKTIQQHFEAQVLKTPNNIALIFEGEELSYKELNEKSNQLARHIRNQYKVKTNNELTPDTLIALYIERSLEMVVSILAVLKSGGAYVPMDTNYPQERIDYILEDTQAEIILSQRKFSNSDQNPIPRNKIICTDLSEDLYKDENYSNLPRYSDYFNLAYIIYTSGTTGKPKGVMIEHNNVVRLLGSSEDHFNFNSEDIWTLFHSYVFDVSVWELWGALFYGGKLLIPSKEQTKDTEAFSKLCIDNKVSVLCQTPSAFYGFADIISNQTTKDKLDLRYIIFAGEALNINQLKTWWEYQNLCNLTTKLINMYGITETTVHVTYKEIKQTEVIQSNIGKSLVDLKSYVLDANFNPVPI